VGKGIRTRGITREEYSSPPSSTVISTVTTRAVRGLEESLGHLGFDYVDLLLMHWSLPGRGLFVYTRLTFEGLMRAEERGRSVSPISSQPTGIDWLSTRTGSPPLTRSS